MVDVTGICSVQLKAASKVVKMDQMLVVSKGVILVAEMVNMKAELWVAYWAAVMDDMMAVVRVYYEVAMMAIYLELSMAVLKEAWMAI